jgi:hypothetical protein
VVLACAHDDSSIFIYNVLANQTTSPGGTCTFSANPSQATIISAGTLDVGLSGNYQAMFLIGNQLVSQADPTKPRTETSTFNVQGGIVRITQADGTPITTYTDLAGGGIPAASGGTPGYVALSIVVVNAQTAALVAVPNNVVRVITYTKIFGKTLGGQYVESNEFEFPVDICVGCLVQFTAADINPLCSNPRNCFGNSTVAASSTTSVPCIPGQDIPIDCSACRETNPAVCNPPCDAGVD